MLRTEYMCFFGVRCVLGCLFVITDREGLWPVLLRNLTKTTGADNVRKVEAAARSIGSQWKVHGPNICFSVSLKGNDDD